MKMSFLSSHRSLLILLACGKVMLCAGIPDHLPGTLPAGERADWREQQREQIVDYFKRSTAEAQGIRDRAWSGLDDRTHRESLRARLGIGSIPEKGTVVWRKLHEGSVVVEEVISTRQDGLRVRAIVLSAQNVPSKREVLIAIPDSNQTAETFAGIAEGSRPPPWLTGLLKNGAVVAVPAMVERTSDHPLCAQLKGKDRRHILHRLGFIVGRTVTGLDVEKVLLLRKELAARSDVDASRISVLGAGQGGMTALYGAALDTAFSAAGVVDYFSQRDETWREPVDRMIFGQLLEFGDAEVAALIAPRKLVLATTATAEISRASAYFRRRGAGNSLLVLPDTVDPLREAAARLFDEGLSDIQFDWSFHVPAKDIESARDTDFEREVDYLRRLIGKSEDKREEFWKRRVKSPAELARFEGIPAESAIPLRSRTRLIRVTDKWVGYEVFTDVPGGMELYGHLLVPRGAAQKLPAVICQHGLDGQPKDISGIGGDPAPAYHTFGAALADKGYVVFAPYLTVPAPQAPLINELVRRAAPLGMMRTAIEVLKLRRVVDFLQTQPFVDSKRIGYYGLSYGGYSTLWMGPLEPRLAAIVISGHFNDWRSKITNEKLATSYLQHPDEDFYNWKVLYRYTHPELIASMAPVPVMVEFAQNDSTTTPEWHQRAWQQVETMIAADRVERDWFLGVHEIGGMRTFEFLNRKLRPGRSSSREYTYALSPNDKKLPGIADRSEDTFPFIVHRLGTSQAAGLRDTFTAAGAFHGVDLRLSRVGKPGNIVVRFGSSEGAEDLGIARIRPEDVAPLYDLWYEARVPAATPVPGRPYFIGISVEPGGQPDSHYLVYGPKPLGGLPKPNRFVFAYRPLRNLGANGAGEPAFEFIREYLQPKLPVLRASGSLLPSAGDVLIDSSWQVRSPVDAGDVVSTAAAELKRFLAAIPKRGTELKRRNIELHISGSVRGVDSAEGFRVESEASGIVIRAMDPRGIMRGIYWLEDAMLSRQAPYLERGVTTRNERLARRITTSVTPGGDRYTETSRPLLYTDGLLQRISRDGFNGIWIWINTEEAAMNSKVFPELDDPEAAVRIGRLADVARRAKRFGVDVYVYLATGYNHHVPDSFYERHPEVRGYGWGSPMETTIPRVRQYQAEIVRNIFRGAPDLKGMVVIFDSEGFYYSGNREASRQQCRTCQNMTQEDIALQLLTNLNDAMRSSGGMDKELIAFSYGRDVAWVERLIPRLPKSILLQNDFSKGGTIVRDGVTHVTGDYNLTLAGPPDAWVRQREAAKNAGLQFVTKTEHAVSQEFVFVPYIPAMEQWARRIEKIRGFQTQGVFANWCHYGYLASPPAQLLNDMAMDPALPIIEQLRSVAVRNYGAAASPLILRAWHHFSEGIIQFPYSDNVVRLPGPLQKGPSNPFFLDPNVPNFGAWRAWQNDLGWTKPWGPAIAAKYLGRVRDEFLKGTALLDQARSVAGESHRKGIAAEWRIGTLLESSLQTMLHLIDWIETRDLLYKTAAPAERRKLGRKMRDILIAERANVQRVLPLLERDSRLGYASEGGGIVRGGLFTPELVRWKLGHLDNTLRLELPRLAGIAPPPVPSSIVEKLPASKAN